ncbi:MAG: hypothetical protein H5T83_02505 [Actinotalea sp.]|nr:hypothetical protein [Actinotalea sp.]
MERTTSAARALASPARPAILAALQRAERLEPLVGPDQCVVHPVRSRATPSCRNGLRARGRAIAS